MTVSTVSVGILQQANVHRRHVVQGDVLQGAGVVNIGWAVMIRTAGATAVNIDLNVLYCVYIHTISSYY